MKMKGAWIAATAFGFLTAAMAPQAMAAGEKDGDQVVCDGINSCKGTGSCAGAGHACAGQNACKGQGHSKVSKKECLAKGGKVVESKKDESKKEAK